ncbi:MAG: hypothetical protein AB7Q01_16440 [Gammaproteobacteria bacterium]
MIRRWLKAWAGRLRVRVIEINGAPYLRRYLVAQAFGCEVYLHEFLTADGERHLHDHPWRWSFSVLLAGGYVEEVLRHVDGYAGPVTSFRTHHAPALNITGRGFHRIARMEATTWTLFVVGPRSKMWGFLEYREDLGGSVYFQPFAYDRAADPLDWSDKPRGRDLVGGAHGAL